MDRTTESIFKTPFSEHKTQTNVRDTIKTTRIGLEQERDKYIDATAALNAYCIMCKHNGYNNCNICPRKHLLDDALSNFNNLDHVRIEQETHKKLMSYIGPGLHTNRTVKSKLRVFGMFALILFLICVPFMIIIGVYGG